MLDFLFHPSSVAVIGASDNPYSWGYAYTHHLLDYGYEGAIYPVNPRCSEILGLKAYPSLKTVPTTVDFAISCIPSAAVLDMLDDCASKQVKGIHLYTARFSETGRPEAAELEQSILKKARDLGIRLIGPNCMGLYCPGEGIAFAYDLPKESGPVGFISQTGGGAAILVHIASMRGIRFSKVISYGNGLDLDESDYLECLAQDPETTVILMYIEGVKDGRRFFSALKRAAAEKPVIITKGGRGQAGSRATASHTASMAGSYGTWEAAVSQAGGISASSYDQLVDLAVLFRFVPPIRGNRVGISGGGGGPSVLAADECEEAGLNVVPLPVSIREELKIKAPDIWDWVSNPTDVSILPGSGFSGLDMLNAMAHSPDFDLLIAAMTEVPLAQREGTTTRFMAEIQGYIDIQNGSAKPMLAVVGEKSLGASDYHHWRWRLTGDIRAALIAANIPFFPTVERAAKAAMKAREYYQNRDNQQS